MPFKIAGSVFFIQAADQGQNLVVRFFTGNAQSGEVDQVGASFKAKPPAPFDGIDLLAPVDTNVTFIIADGDIDFQLPGIGVTVNNTATNPVPVSIVAEPGQPFEVTNVPGQDLKVSVDGTVNVSGATLTATNVGITPAGTGVSEAGNTTVATGAATHVLAAAAGRKRAIFYNAGNGRIGLGGAAGLTFANAAIVLQPGDAWKETDGPQLDWYAVSDTGSSVNIQTVN
ncbi:hypothetical protein WS90_08005 [Burkholderia cepacia]|uniref:Uncharacterized protein n=2 Tax=Burkholderia cepacia TaxID=292 RepID=A0A103ZU86_BURCE|nr:hypothetical protein WS90_08005 [Burkholderia cepacia]